MGKSAEMRVVEGWVRVRVRVRVRVESKGWAHFT